MSLLQTVKSEGSSAQYLLAPLWVLAETLSLCVWFPELSLPVFYLYSLYSSTCICSPSHPICISLSPPTCQIYHYLFSSFLLLIHLTHHGSFSLCYQGRLTCVQLNKPRKMDDKPGRLQTQGEKWVTYRGIFRPLESDHRVKLLRMREPGGKCVSTY